MKRAFWVAAAMVGLMTAKLEPQAAAGQAETRVASVTQASSGTQERGAAAGEAQAAEARVASTTPVAASGDDGSVTAAPAVSAQPTCREQQIVLKQVQSAAYPLTLQRGHRYDFKTGYEGDIRDVDLRLYDADGQVIAEDIRPGAEASIDLAARWSGRYTLKAVLFRGEGLLKVHICEQPYERPTARERVKTLWSRVLGRDTDAREQVASR